MSHHFKSLLLGAFAALLLSVPAFSQTTAVEGLVKSPDGKPLVGAVVDFARTDIKGSYTVKTDKKGHYGHYGLPIGTFDVTVTVDGQVRDKMRGVRTKLGEPVSLNFDLKDQTQQAVAEPETKGMSKEEKEKFDKANKSREAQLAKNKELNDAFQAGRAALEAKKYDEAIESLVKAAGIDEKQVVIWGNLAEAYVGSAGEKPTEAAAIYEKAFEAYKKAIELKPEEASYYNNYALALAKDKKMDEARTNLDKAAQLDTAGAGKYYYNMGALLVNSGQSEAAGASFKRAVEADPSYADAQYQYGLYLASKADTDKTGKVIAPPGTIEALQQYLQC